jgi:sugar O-acyltransferase (sialic acid O-acetyltransferase NeuD family)
MIKIMKKEKLVIIGAGGSGKDILATLLRCNKISQKYKILGFLDDDESLIGTEINGFLVIGNLEWLSEQSSVINCVITNGFSKIRKKIVKKIEKFNVNFPTILDPSVILANDVKIGKGTIIQAGTIINPDTIIGDYTFINIDCTIGHDCKIQNYVTIAPGVHINGNNLIGENSEIGSGCVTIQNITIEKNCTLGAGTVLIKNIPEKSTVVGNPGKIIK